MAVAQEKPSTNAIIALVLGILSFLGGNILTGIPAWILGRNEVAAISAGRSPEAGRTLAILAVLAVVVMVTIGGGLAAWTVGTTPR
jgi:hypothetical protein